MNISKLIQKAVDEGHIIEYTQDYGYIQVRNIDGIEFKIKDGNRYLREIMNDPWGKKKSKRVKVGGDSNGEN